MHFIFDPTFSSMPHADRYRSWVYPEIAPQEPQAVLKNWSEDDLEMFCGIYTENRKRDLRVPRYDEGLFADATN